MSEVDGALRLTVLQGIGEADDPPDPDFQSLLDSVFPTTETRIVSFPNPLQDRQSESTVYLAQCAS